MSEVDSKVYDWPLTNWVDAHPSKDEIWYTVTAVDNIGNESPPADAQSQNFVLLPINSLTVVVSNDTLPVIRWTHPYEYDIRGYDLYIGPEGDQYKQNDVPFRDKLFVDDAYRGGERDYAVVTVDDYGEESPARSIHLPDMTASLLEGEELRRGIINRLTYAVTNHGASAVSNVNLRVIVGSMTNISTTFNVQPSTSTNIDVVIGGSTGLTEIVTLWTAIEVVPAEGDLVQIIRTTEMPAIDDRIVAGVLCEGLYRGAAEVAEGSRKGAKNAKGAEARRTGESAV